MSNANRWYTTREAVKAAVGISGTDKDAQIDGNIEAGSEDVERILLRRFIPETAVKYFRWPQRIGDSLTLTFPDEDLIAVTLLQSEAQDSSPTTIDEADFFVEPVNAGPPYTRIELDLSASAAFSSGDTPQRSIAVTGRWGFGEDTKAAGTVASGLASSSSATSCVCSDASLIGVGNTLLIEDEAIFVSKKTTADVGTNTNGALTANKAEVTITVVDGTAIIAGEVMIINSERMLIESISGNDATVERAYDGSVLAAHNDAQDIYTFRTLTLVRGVNGTEAATHANATVIATYAPPGDIAKYVLAYAISQQKLDESGHTGMIGGDLGGVETKMFSIWSMRKALIEKYRRVAL